MEYTKRIGCAVRIATNLPAAKQWAWLESLPDAKKCPATNTGSWLTATHQACFLADALGQQRPESGTWWTPGKDGSSEPSGDVVELAHAFAKAMCADDKATCDKVERFRYLSCAVQECRKEEDHYAIKDDAPTPYNGRLDWAGKVCGFDFAPRR